MLLELIIALFLGILIGSITGLLPGIHINLVAALLISLSVFFISITQPLTLVIFIVSMSITHTFIDFIPSIFLGAPDEDTSLSILPGHQLLISGKGYEALVSSLTGCMIGVSAMLILAPLFILLLPEIFFYLKFVMFLILVLASSYMIIRNENKPVSLVIFILAGFLGFSSLSLNLKDSLLPLLSGLFGSSSLITSIAKEQKLPEQIIPKLKELKPKAKEISDVFLASIVSSPLCSFLPALGSSQAAVIGSDIIEEKNQKKFLMLLGSINIIVLGLSFVTLYSIGKSRTGAAAAVSKLIEISLPNLIIILAAIILASLFSFLIAVFIGKVFSKNISKINYKTISIITLVFLSTIVLIFSGLLGFLLFLVSTFLGLTVIYAGVRRTNLMGSLMLTSILFYLPL
jgi:putative membrane protein